MNPMGWRGGPSRISTGLGGDDHASECGEGEPRDDLTRRRGQQRNSERLTMTSLTNEMLEMVPSTREKECGQHGALNGCRGVRLRHVYGWPRHGVSRTWGRKRRGKRSNSDTARAHRVVLLSAVYLEVEG